jgi:hypothetical protein
MHTPKEEATPATYINNRSHLGVFNRMALEVTRSCLAESNAVWLVQEALQWVHRFIPHAEETPEPQLSRFWQDLRDDMVERKQQLMTALQQ